MHCTVSSEGGSQMIASGHMSAHARWKYVLLVSSLSSRASDS